MTTTNPNSRLEAFCDGVFAIALTLLIIEIKIPHTVPIHNSSDLWYALWHIAPAIFAFVLSFVIILITWVNHHNNFKLINRSSPSFIYANGFLLLTVVFMPFPTALLGEYLLTDHAAPAVVLYIAVMAVQSIGWILICKSAIKSDLGKSAKAMEQIGKNGKFGYFAFVLYTVCAIAAFWFPVTLAIITTIIWIFWLVYGISFRREEMN